MVGEDETMLNDPSIEVVRLSVEAPEDDEDVGALGRLNEKMLLLVLLIPEIELAGMSLLSPGELEDRTSEALSTDVEPLVVGTREPSEVIGTITPIVPGCEPDGNARVVVEGTLALHINIVVVTHAEHSAPCVGEG